MEKKNLKIGNLIKEIENFPKLIHNEHCRQLESEKTGIEKLDLTFSKFFVVKFVLRNLKSSFCDLDNVKV